MYDRRKSPPRQMLVSLVCLGVLVFLALQTIGGPHGLEARRHLIERSDGIASEIERLEAVRDRLQQEIRLLQAGDEDFIEELARAELGFVRPDDQLLARR